MQLASVIIALLISVSAIAQGVVGPAGRIGASGVLSGPTIAIAGFVEGSSKNSTLTNTLTTNPTGQTACPSYSYCIPLADSTNQAGTSLVSGNLGVVYFQYNHSSTAVTETATDNKGDSWTCGSSSGQIGSGYWVNYCYFPNLSAGVTRVTVTFGTTVVSEVMAKTEIFYNVANTSPLDASNLCVGSSSTTAGSCAVTTTTANDMLSVYVARVGTPSVSSYTAGSGMTLDTTDIRDGSATEYGIDSSTGSTSPSMTMASASTYGMIVLAFKSAGAGTAPSGWYNKHLMSWSSAYNGAGATFNFQFPSSGNLLFNSTSCGDMTPGSITDSTNTWTNLGPNTEPAVILGENYAANAVANSSGLISTTTTATSGDCSFSFYDFTGAPSSPIVSRNPQQNAVGSTAATLLLQANVGPDGASTSADWLPDPASGLVILVGGQGFDTSVSVNAPSTGCVWDGGSYGGMNLSGPGGSTNPIIDENNIWSHCYFNSGSQPWYVINESSATTATSAWGNDIISIYGTGAAIKNWTEAESTSTPLTITVPSTTSGNLGAVACAWYDTTAVTMSSICFDGTTCATANKFTAVPSSTAAGSSARSATAVWDLLSLPASKTTLTVTTSGAVTDLECSYFEVQKSSGSWAIDNSGNGAATSGGTGSGTTINGPAITTSGGSNGAFCAAVNGLNGGPTTGAPASGNEFTYGNVIFNNDTNSSIALLTTSNTSHTPSWTETVSGDTFNASNACFK
jgi:hypothetical protein